jgi:general secretion pathway protein H
MLELLLVLVLMAVGAALAAPAIEGGLQSRQLWRATRQLAATLRHLRGEALATGTMQEMVIDPRRSAYQASTWNGAVVLPEPARVVGVHGGDASGGELVRVFFFPNGGTTGLEVLVGTDARPDLARYRVTLDPLVGTVSVSDADG